MTTYICTSPPRPGRQTLTLHVVVNADGVVTAVSCPDRECFNATFLDEPWDEARAMFMEDWTITEEKGDA